MAKKSNKPLMPLATAVWLVDNTSLTFQQIADFVGVHLLEVQAIADDKINVGPISPIANDQLTQSEIARCQKDATASLKLNKSIASKSKQARAYVPLIKRQQKVEVIAWLVRHHPHLPDAEVAKLMGATVNSVKNVRAGTHISGETLNPRHPVESGFCSRAQLDEVLERNKQKSA